MAFVAITFQDTILRLQAFWAGRGCLVWQPVNTEVGAGTMNPATFLRVLGPEPWHVAYVEPSVRPDDSRYGENPNRIQTHTQFQVILKPGPDDPQQLYLDSLAAIGIDTAREDIRFVEDNWQQPGARRLGPRLGGLAQRPRDHPVHVLPAGRRDRARPGPRRDHLRPRADRDGPAGRRRFQDIEYAARHQLRRALGRSEYEWSVYYLDWADVERTRQLFSLHEQEARALIGAGWRSRPTQLVRKCSHLFNVLDARGAVGVAERAAYFARMRELARTISELWLGTEPAPRPSPGRRGRASRPSRTRPSKARATCCSSSGSRSSRPPTSTPPSATCATAAPGELERRRPRGGRDRGPRHAAAGRAHRPRPARRRRRARPRPRLARRLRRGRHARQGGRGLRPQARHRRERARAGRARRPDVRRGRRPARSTSAPRPPTPPRRS